VSGAGDAGPIRRVLVLGATGLIGGASLRDLSAHGFAVSALARRPPPPGPGGVDWRAGDLNRLTTPEAWAPLLRGIDAIVNAAGVLDDGAGDDARRVVVDAVTALVAAADAANARLIVQISAVGADEASPEPFMRLKAEAEAAIRGGRVPHAILRPGLVVGPIAYGGSALLRALAAAPFAVPATTPDALVQAVGDDEVAEVVRACLSGAIPPGATHDLVEDEPRPLAEVLRLFRALHGLAPAPILAVPEPIAGPVGWVADALGRLGWRSPLRTAARRLAAAGVVGDPAPLRAARGRGFRSLPETLARLPTSPQEAWFARLYLLKPVLIGLFAVFWVASGVIALFAADAAAAILSARGAPDALARAVVFGGAALDVAIGLAGLFARHLGRAALASVALSLAYLAGGTLFAPDLWADPLGPLVKILPVIALGLTLWAIARARP
jgi:uncharacterized protein YbjT (DUF2867 family)